MPPAVRSSRARAQLTLKEPPASVGAKPGGTIARLDLQFNPSTLQLRKTTEWRRSPSRMAEESALPEFVGSGPRELSLEVFLDATATHDNSVEQAVEKLMKACVPTPASLGRKKPASPWVRFEWGTARTTSFDGVLSSLSVTYTLFDVDGRPRGPPRARAVGGGPRGTPGPNPPARPPPPPRPPHPGPGDHQAP
ncbi:CIS tube protein, partial [Streptomyces tricolor]